MNRNILFLFLLFTTLWVGTVRATSYTWQADDGVWTNSANWTGGVNYPGQSPGDTALFTNSVNFAITNDAAVLLSVATFQNPTNAATLELLANLTLTSSFLIGNQANTTGSVTLVGSGRLAVTNSSHTAQLIVGQSGGVGTLTLDGGTLAVDQLLGSPYFYFNGGTLITSNAVGNTASSISLANPVIKFGKTQFKVNGTWNMLGGVNTVAANSGPFTVTIGYSDGTVPDPAVSNALVNVASGAVWDLGGNLLQLGFGWGYGTAENNSLVINGGTVQNVGSVSIGYGWNPNGSHNSLVISNGGSFASGNLALASPAAPADSGGNYNLYQVGGLGAPSTAINGAIQFSYTDDGASYNTMTITNASLTTADFTMGKFAAAAQFTGNVVNVRAGGLWDLQGSSMDFTGGGPTFSNGMNIVGGTVFNVIGCNLGTGSFNYFMTINNGTLSNDGSMTVGGQGGASNVVTVLANGNLQLLSGAGALTIGQGGKANKLVVDGGTVALANGANSVAFQVGLLWSTGSALGNSAVVSNGGQIVATAGGAIVVGGSHVTGAGDISSNNYFQVGGLGAPSTVSNVFELYVGETSSAYNQLVVTNATLCSGGGTLGGNYNSSVGTNLNNSALVQAGGTWDLLQENLTIGGSGKNNTPTGVGAINLATGNVVVVNGGVITNVNQVIISFSTNTYRNSLVISNGAFYSGDITVGSSGPGSNVLSITGGTLASSSTLTVNTNNQLAVYGGQLSATNLVMYDAATLTYQLPTAQGAISLATTDIELHGTLNVVNGGGFANNTTYLLMTYGGGSVLANTMTINPLPGGYSGAISNDATHVWLVVGTGGGGGGDPYTTWQSFYGLSGGNAAGTADPDGDGMINTNEFLAGFNPTNPAAYLHIISNVKSGNDMVISYLGANGDGNGSPGPKTNILEFTAGTGNGSYSNNFTSTGQTNILSGGTGLGVVTNMIESGGATNKPARYYRVRVLAP